MNNNLFKSYLRCKRKAWLDFQGNFSESTWSPHKAIQLLNENSTFEKFSNKKLDFGLKGCENGSQNIIGCKFRGKFNNKTEIEVYPPLLIKTRGKSIWGEYQYFPAVSKLGRRTTKDHLLELALCAIILEKYQKTKIKFGLIVSNFQNKLITEKVIINNKLKNKATNRFLELIDSLNKKIPEITRDRKKCSICSWQNYCDREAKSKGFLTDIDGIGSKTAELLIKIGVNNVKTLAESDKFELSEKLSSFQEINSDKTSKYINQSKSYITGVPELLSKKQIAPFKKRLESGFFIFDIESNPDAHHDFLYGFLSISNLHKPLHEEKYEPIINLNPSLEVKLIFKLILQKIRTHKEWPILHYGETERYSILRLAKDSDLNSDQVKTLETRFIDLHSLMRDSWVLPLKNYSLKTVATWTGFQWSQSGVSGSKALFWWIKYLQTKKQTYLEKIIKYNKDDCLATLSIAIWLIQNSENEL